jgi:Rho GDP-dissociation inhibitor
MLSMLFCRHSTISFTDFIRPMSAFLMVLTNISTFFRYKVGEKKSVAEYAKLGQFPCQHVSAKSPTNQCTTQITDAEDESLARWKASLGIGATTTSSISEPGDNRTVYLRSVAMRW